MHDAIIGERLGLPSVAIMTSQFVSAANLMARVLGANEFKFITVDHPISSADNQELQTRAREAAAGSARLLTAAR